MIRADPLSRRPDHEEGVHNDNEGQTLLKPEFFTIKAIQTSHETTVNDAQLLDKIKEAQAIDEMTRDYRALLASGPQEFGKTLRNGTLKRRRLKKVASIFWEVILKNFSFQGIEQTLNLKRLFWQWKSYLILECLNE